MIKKDFSDSRWKDIYSHLKSKGFDVYAPAQHEGECVSKYIVVKVGTTQAESNGFSSTARQYDIMMYVPRDEYSKLEPFVESVKEAMKELHPMIRPMRYEGGSFYDDTVKGHMVSMQYYNYRKNT